MPVSRQKRKTSGSQRKGHAKLVPKGKALGTRLLEDTRNETDDLRETRRVAGSFRARSRILACSRFLHQIHSCSCL